MRFDRDGIPSLGSIHKVVEDGVHHVRTQLQPLKLGEPYDLACITILAELAVCEIEIFISESLGQSLEPEQMVELQEGAFHKADCLVRMARATIEVALTSLESYEVT